MADDDGQDRGGQPEYDMEFVAYGPNVMEIPMSPPHTPTMDDDLQLEPFQREASPFSSNTSMTSIDSTDSVGYYREEGGRMFPAQPDLPVVLPVDNAEMLRISAQHEILKLVWDGNYFGPVRELLTRVDGRTRNVLDVVCNSPWIDEMAEEFPRVKFHGHNFVPTRHPYRENLILKIYNLNEGLQGQDGSFDLIHASGIFKMAPQTRDFRWWLREFRRLLRPGGLLLIKDLEMTCWMVDGSSIAPYMPTLAAFTQAVYESLLAQGIDITDLPHVGSWMQEMGGWDHIDHSVTSIPVGNWDKDEVQRQIGTMARNNIMSALHSCGPLWRRLGKTPQEVENLLARAQHELYDLNLHIFERLFSVVARRGRDS